MLDSIRGACPSVLTRCVKRVGGRKQLATRPPTIYLRQLKYSADCNNWRWAGGGSTGARIARVLEVGLASQGISGKEPFTNYFASNQNFIVAVRDHQSKRCESSFAHPIQEESQPPPRLTLSLRPPWTIAFEIQERGTTMIMWMYLSCYRPRYPLHARNNSDLSSTYEVIGVLSAENAICF